MAAAAQGGNSIVFKVKPQDAEGECLFFKMNTMTEFMRFFTEYCSRRENPLKETDTPATVGMNVHLQHAAAEDDEIIVDALHEGQAG